MWGGFESVVGAESELFWYYKMQFDTVLGLRAYFRLDHGFLLDPDIFGSRRQFMKHCGDLSDALTQIKERAKAVAYHCCRPFGFNLGAAFM